jgi:nucleotide-binding universal stress UspA family protein
MVANLKNIILVPTDFSDACLNAANQAISTAKLLNYGVVLLHVINSQTKAFLKEENLPTEAIQHKITVLADDLSQLAKINIGFIVREGSIFTTISDVADEIGANLIFLGTHGKSGIQHLTGSFALKVIISSPVPVIVVQKRPFDKGYKDIILTISSDLGPMERTQWAIYISKQFNATIHVFVIEDANDEIRGAADQITNYFEKNNISYSYKEAEKHSQFAKQTIDYATSINADMILIMTNPDKGLASFLLGNDDEEILFNSSQIPVMCLNPRRLNYELNN